MARAGRFLFNLLLAGALGGAAYVGWVSYLGSPVPVDLLPGGAGVVVQARNLESLSRQLAGTRFGAAFAQSATRQWLERTAPVAAFDAVLADIGRISRVAPGRDSAFDLVGTEAAVAWYPPAGGGGASAAPWVAGGRLSLRAWAAATAMRLGLRVGIGTAHVNREDAAGRTIYSLPGGAGEALYGFLAGRVLVAGTDRALVVKAAHAVSDPGVGVTREPGWLGIRKALPAGGDFFLWARERGTLPGGLPASLVGRGSAGVSVRAGARVEIDVAAEPASPRQAPAPAGRSSSLPGLALLQKEPLFLLSSRGPVPSAITDLLQTRRRLVVRRNPGSSQEVPPFPQGDGFAVVLTEGAGGSGLFPAPRGLVMIGMPGAGESASTLASLFPPDARTATAGGTRALATRESFPLAGEFEFWGAAIGSQLVFATETALIDAATGTPAAETGRQSGDPSWTVDAVASLSMEKALPLLQRWSAPLSGLAAVRLPDAPDVTQDLALLGAVGTVRMSAGSDDRYDRAAITLTLHDLRAGR